MSYTYDDFVNAANKSGMMARFSENDLSVAQKNPEYGLSMLSLMQDSDKATTPEQRLLTTEAVNQLRKNYGIYDNGSGGYASSAGSTIQGTMDKIDNYGSFNYGNEDASQKALQNVINHQPFQYDPEKDSSFVNSRAAMLRERKRATEDTMAKAAASTGGVASTAAVVAAQQAADYYNSQISDMLPAYEETAYQRYLNDFNQKMNVLGVLQDDRNSKYQEWMNGLGVLRENLEMHQKQDGIDYDRYLNSETIRQQNESQQKQELLESAKLMASAGDFSGYGTLYGLTPEQIQALTAKYQQEIRTKEDAEAYAKALDGANLAAQAGDYSGFVALGLITSEQAQKLTEEFNRPSTEAANQQAYNEKIAAAEMMAEAGDYTRLAKLLGLTEAEVQILMNTSVKGDPEGEPPGNDNPGNTLPNDDTDRPYYEVLADRYLPGNVARPTSPSVPNNGLYLHLLQSNPVQGNSPNLNSDGTYTVDGKSMTVLELLEKVDSGEIIETYDPKTDSYTYKYRYTGLNTGVNNQIRPVTAGSGLPRL